MQCPNTHCSLQVNRWTEAVVKEVDGDSQRVLVSYLHWSSKWDEYIHLDSERLAPIHTHTYYVGGVLKLGQRLEVQDERQNRLEAYVMDETVREVKVHYKDYNSRYDEWLSRSSPRIAPFGASRGHRQHYVTEKLGVHWPVPGKAVAERRRRISEASDKYQQYVLALSALGLSIVRVQGDGNCLFRGVSHQV
jgi:OTU domain-containing protein 5